LIGKESSAVHAENTKNGKFCELRKVA